MGQSALVCRNRQANAIMIRAVAHVAVVGAVAITLTDATSLTATHLQCDASPLPGCITCDNTQTCYELATPRAKTPGECCLEASKFPLPAVAVDFGKMWN